MNRRYTLIAATLGFYGVALGAFGAHTLQETLAAKQTTELWRTAVFYHLLHSVAMLALAQTSSQANKRLSTAMACWSLGVILFSGSLYGLALGGPRLLGPITPLGGLAFLLGWALVFAEAWSTRKPAPPTVSP